MRVLESFGLNDLSWGIRLLVVMLGILVSLFVLVNVRKGLLKKRRNGDKLSERVQSTSNQRGRDSMLFDLVVTIFGVLLIITFLFSSNFLFFLVGLFLIITAGLLAISHGKARSRRRVKGGSRK
jgi:Flp pilus assembly protein TadB